MNVLRGVSSSDGFVTPAYLRMFAKVACRFGIRCVQISTDLSTVCFSPAGGSGTLKYVNSAIVNVFDDRCRLEENVNR